MVVVVVDDFQSYRAFVVSELRKRAESQVIYEASDGLEAVLLAKEHQPDLILLDVGLPKLNGIEAARQIREAAPNSKILFISQEKSRDVVREALTIGQGYLVKSDGELLVAVDAVLQGKQFVSVGLRTHDATSAP